MALLSAISSSALSNIIAYESFREEGPSTGSYTLRMLSDDQIHSDSIYGAAGGMDAGKYSFDTTQVSFQALSCVSFPVDSTMSCLTANTAGSQTNLAAHNMSTMLYGSKLPKETFLFLRAQCSSKWLR